MKVRAVVPLSVERRGFIRGLPWLLLGSSLLVASSCSLHRDRPPAPPPPSQIPGNLPPSTDPSLAERNASSEDAHFSAAEEPLPPFPRRVFFGDPHIHSSWSVEAGLAGATVAPEDVYRYARGEKLTLPGGKSFRAKRPLDFVILADNAENLGLVDYLERSDFRLLRTSKGRRWHDLFHAGRSYDVFAEWSRSTRDPLGETKLLEDAWSKVVAAAERNYQPGKFSTFAAFEWTSEPQGNCLHRTVLFRDPPPLTKTIVPLSRYDAEQPEELWRYLEGYERSTKGRAIAIPHNGNFSNGLMFDEMTSEGRTMQPDDVNRRRHFEPLYEVTQMKGDTETHPDLSPDDDFAQFERIDVGNLDASAQKESRMLPGEYARSALLRGLRLEDARAQNPFQFGLTGGTDAHTGLSTPQEDGYLGVAPMAGPTPDRLTRVFSQGDRLESRLLLRELSASGLTGVWARGNTRAEIFDALVRREVYATTGSRITVRVFAGYALEKEDLEQSDLGQRGYAKGVPMGGELHAAPFGKRLRLLVRAEKDPRGANLERLQVIKGFLDDGGATRERIFDVAVTDGRTIGPTGRCKKNLDSTVDPSRASYENTVGEAKLEALFEDPTFDPKQLAFYYVRVLEIKKPRWTLHDSVAFDVEIPEGTETIVQDRAYTSPIWYLPNR